MKSVVLVFVLAFVSLSAFAQTVFRGSAKFVCGKVDDEHVKAFAFAPGIYYTTINVTNANKLDVSGTKRFSIALLAERAGTFTPVFRWTLKPGEAMQIDCRNIYRHTGVLPGTFIDGFMRITGSPGRFDVTAVYTLSDGERPVSMDVEAITLRP